MNNLNLLEAEKLEVTVLVDNYTDLFLLERTETIKRYRPSPTAAPLAEHGLSFLVKVRSASEEHTLMVDAGRSPTCLLHNLEVFGVDLGRIEGMVLSHGHRDHFGGLLDFLKRVGKGLPLTLHPDAFLERRINIPKVGVRAMPALDEEALRQTGAVLHKVREATPLYSNLILALGEVERVTDFEKGFPWAEAKIDGNWVVDPFHDDQGIAVNVRGKGLVVIGGCSHAGIINTVRYAREVSGVDRVHAVLGGFHLTGPIFKPIIGPTIEAMKKIAPDFVVPMHCTGWDAMNQFSQQMPGQFILNSVGTTYVFQRSA
jgi:7,8-dihydropterin-6-yl-methyl-4-(beta-D-ribofuranosyl)aminobenzene 5'-phosphate synthase